MILTALLILTCIGAGALITLNGIADRNLFDTIIGFIIFLGSIILIVVTFGS